MISHLPIPWIVVHGKYHHFQIALLYFCVCSAYLVINLLIYFLFFDGAYDPRGIYVLILFYIVFTLIFKHLFLLFVYIFIPKTGFHKYNNGGTFLVLFYLIPFCWVLSLLFFHTIPLSFLKFPTAKYRFMDLWNHRPKENIEIPKTLNCIKLIITAQIQFHWKLLKNFRK